MPLDENYPAEVRALLARRVKHFRTLLGLSMEDLAARGPEGLRSTSISRVERGQNVTVNTVSAIAAGLGISFEDLLREE